MQGFNMGRYVPPDVEGTTSGNKLHKKHALGQRASKLGSHGILTVRFEMPFPIWCGSCAKPTIIGQGVRFNAEKKRAGNYYTTPIWSFRFRHAECGGLIEMRTDPKNTAYVVVEGATKQDTGEDKVKAEQGDISILTDQEREALRRNAFASLEKTIEDREQLKQASQRIDDLMDVSSRQWDDPYTQNQKLRKTFRSGRKERERLTAATEDLRDRMSLGIELLPEAEEDGKRAALVDFGALDEDEVHSDKALSKPLFASSAKAKPAVRTTSLPGSSSSSLIGGKLKSEKVVSKRKETLVSELMSNTRAAQDPFLQGAKVAGSTPPTGKLLLGVKRKLADTNPPSDVTGATNSPSTVALGHGSHGGPPTKTTNTAAKTQSAPTSSKLVQYDSD